MRVGFELPKDAVPEENPYRTAELPHVPRVGDLIEYSDLSHCLVVTKVAWNVQRIEDGPFDVGRGIYATLEWHYVDDPVGGAV